MKTSAESKGDRETRSGGIERQDVEERGDIPQGAERHFKTREEYSILKKPPVEGTANWQGAKYSSLLLN